MSHQDLDFAYKVRHALNEKIEQLPAHVIENLASSRQMAVSRKKQESPLRALVRQNAWAGHVGNFFSTPGYYWLSRIGAMLVLGVLITGLMGIYHVEEQYHIKETANMDIAVLSDDLPPKAYLDQGFKHYLHKQGI